MARHLPLHEIATIREVGHAPYWEAPEAFNGLVLDFLRRHRWQP
jgi:pimeloyl-ACP methyl ester carboxylesterase